jgi:hypothetical protein
VRSIGYASHQIAYRNDIVTSGRFSNLAPAFCYWLDNLNEMLSVHWREVSLNNCFLWTFCLKSCHLFCLGDQVESVLSLVKDTTEHNCKCLQWCQQHMCNNNRAFTSCAIMEIKFHLLYVRLVSVLIAVLNLLGLTRLEECLALYPVCHRDIQKVLRH